MRWAKACVDCPVVPGRLSQAFDNWDAASPRAQALAHLFLCEGILHLVGAFKMLGQGTFEPEFVARLNKQISEDVTERPTWLSFYDTQNWNDQ